MNDNTWKELALAAIAFLQLLALGGITYIVHCLDGIYKRSSRHDTQLAQHELRIERVEDYCGFQKLKHKTTEAV